MQIINRRAAMLFSAALLLAQPLATIASAQTDPRVLIDKMLRSDLGMPTSAQWERQMLIGYKQWLGRYQRLITKDEDSYVAVFDSGSLPIDIRRGSTGSIEGYSFGCPITRSLSISDAPSSIQRDVAKCSNFKRQN